MKPDSDLQIINFLWNRQTYWQKKKRRLSAGFYLYEPRLYAMVYTVVSFVFSLVTQGLPVTDRRVRKAHFINDRRHQSPRSPQLITFLFIIATVSIATWLIALNIHPSYAAPLMFFNLISLSAILVFKPVGARSPRPMM